MRLYQPRGNHNNLPLGQRFWKRQSVAIASSLKRSLLTANKKQRIPPT